MAVSDAKVSHRFRGDERADGEMTGYMLMIGVLVVFAGVLFVVTSNLADQDIKNDPPAAVAHVHGQNQMEFQLIKAGPGAPYNLDVSMGTTNHDVLVILDGVECSYADGDFRVDGADDLWHVGERLTFDGDDCSGASLSAFRTYSITISVGEKVVYQDSVQPDP